MGSALLNAGEALMRQYFFRDVTALLAETIDTPSCLSALKRRLAVFH